MSRFARPALLLALAGCASSPADPAQPEGSTVTAEMLKPLTNAYREFVASLVQLGSLQPKERSGALLRLQSSPYAYFPDDRALIAKAAGGDDAARRELFRRGELLDAMFVFWEKVDLLKWNDARKRIMALGQDARVVLVNTLLRMLLNGQMREVWPQIRFQLIATGEDAFVTAVALLKAQADNTPSESIIFHKDDLVQVTLVVMGFGEKGRPVIQEHAKSPRINVRRAIAVALGEGRATEHFDILDGLLRKDPDWRVRADAAIAIGSIRDRAKAGDALLEALKTERDRKVRRHVAESLGVLIHAAAVPSLVSSLDMPDFEYVETAMLALFRITGERFMNAEEWRRWYEKDYLRWKNRPR